MHYSDLIDTEVQLDARDTLSEALYRNTRYGFHEPVSETAIAKIEPKTELRNVPRMQLRKVMAGAHQGWVRALCVDEVTNNWFASGGQDAMIKVWDLASGTLKASLQGHVLGVRALVVSKRYPYLFSGAEDKTVRCWDLERTHSTAGCQIRNYHGHVGGVYACALHPELDLLFTGGRDAVVRVWDLRSRREAMVLVGHHSDVSSLVAQTGDPQVCSAGMDGTVRLWDIRKQTTHLALTQHTKSVRLLVMHPREMTMTSGDSTGTMRQWHLPTGRLLRQFGQGGVIETMAINPATNELFAGFGDGRMRFCDYESGALLHEDKTAPVAGASLSAIYAAQFDMLGLRLLTAESDKSIKVWATSQSATGLP